MASFPAPIGGTVLPSDFAPSVVFAILYALLAPLMLYRVYDRRSRCTLLIGRIIFSVERVITFSLRAVQARDESRRFSKGVLTYMQISFGLGFIGKASDLVGLMRCLLVNPTYGTEMYPQSPAAATKDGVMTAPPEGTPDMPNFRLWSRRFSDIASVIFLAATIIGIIANAKFGAVLDDQEQADKTARIRYASTAVALGLTILVFSVVVWGKRRLPRISQRGVAILSFIMGLVSTIAIYRLSVMHFKTTSLSAPSPLNSAAGKATFYIFHVVPEWLASLTFFSYNLRKTFGTGLFGDWRSRDETEKEKEKREAREAKKKAEANEVVDLA